MINLWLLDTNFSNKKSSNNNNNDYNNNEYENTKNNNNNDAPEFIPESTRKRLVRFISPRDIHKIVDIDNERLVSGNTAISTTKPRLRETISQAIPQVSGMVVQNDLTESNILQSFDQRIQKSITKSRNKIQGDSHNHKDQSSPILNPTSSSSAAIAATNATASPSSSVTIQKKKSISNLLKTLQVSQREIKNIQILNEATNKAEQEQLNTDKKTTIPQQSTKQSFSIRRAQTVRFITKQKDSSLMSPKQSSHSSLNNISHSKKGSPSNNHDSVDEKVATPNSHNQSVSEKKNTPVVLSQQSYFPSDRSIIIRTKKPFETENGISPIRPSLKKPSSPILKSESMVVSTEKKKSLFHIKRDQCSSNTSFESTEKNSFIIQSFPENELSENEDAGATTQDSNANNNHGKQAKQSDCSSSSNNSIKHSSKKIFFDQDEDSKTTSKNNIRMNVSQFMEDNIQAEQPLTPIKPTIKNRILRSTTLNSLESTKDKSMNDELKESFKNKINGIYKNAEEVSRELIEDLNVYSEALDITSQFESAKRSISKDAFGVRWNEDPEFIKAKKLLKRKVEEQSETEENMHPYFQFLGYKAASQVPRDRSKQEIIEQRYAYFLHSKEKSQPDIMMTKSAENPMKPKTADSTKSLSKSFNHPSKLNRSLNSGVLDMSLDEKVPSSSRSLKVSINNANSSNRIESDSNLEKPLTSSRRLFKNQAECTTKSSSSLSRIPASSSTSLKKRGSESPQAVPIVQQILTRYGRNNYEEGNAIRDALKKISDGSKQKMNAQFFIDEVNEKKSRLASKFAKIFSNPDQLKKFFALENIFKKFSSKQKLDLEKLYRSEKEWDYLMNRVENHQVFLEDQTTQARVGLKKIKSVSQHSPFHIEQLYKKATQLTGMTFYDQEGNPLRQQS